MLWFVITLLLIKKYKFIIWRLGNMLDASICWKLNIFGLSTFRLETSRKNVKQLYKNIIFFYFIFILLNWTYEILVNMAHFFEIFEIFFYFFSPHYFSRLGCLSFINMFFGKKIMDRKMEGKSEWNKMSHMESRSNLNNMACL